MKAQRAANQTASPMERVMVVYGAKMQVMACADCKLNLTLVITERRCQLAWCMACARNLKVVTNGLTKNALRIKSYTIRQWVDSGSTQFIHTSEGVMLIILTPNVKGISLSRLRRLAATSALKELPKAS